MNLNVEFGDVRMAVVEGAEEAVDIRIRPRRLVRPVIRYDDVDENERTRRLQLERKRKV